MLKITRTASLLFSLTLLLAARLQPVSADTAKPKPPTNYTKGQSQLAGGNGEFGVVYSLQDGWNEEILSAAYTLEPFIADSKQTPGTNEKLIVLTVAVKNTKPTPQWFNKSGRYILCDQFGKQYDRFAESLSSDPESPFHPTLNPGQGSGQPGLNDPLRIAFVVDGKSKITKIIINEGRLGHSEKVLRFFLKGATAAEDGGDGDPKNVVSPLPANVQDPSDPTGATALAVGNGGKPGSGAILPTNLFDFSVDSFGDAPAGTTVNKSLPGANMKFVQAFLTIYNKTPDPIESYWMKFAGTHEITDTDGDTYKLDATLKASSDGETSNYIQPNGSLKLRFVFEIPSNTKLQTLQIGSYQARLWNFDISGS